MIGFRTYNLQTTLLWQRDPDPLIKREFRSTVDHSKWAVAWETADEQPAKKVICVGDINRAVREENVLCMFVFRQYFWRLNYHIDGCFAANLDGR